MFRNNSDTEVLVHGYEEYGTDLPKYCRGMFAFMIYDANKDIAFGARDYFGIKPFYYSLVNGNLVFGSEIKSILEYPGYEKKVNTEALEEYLTFQYSVLPETFSRVSLNYLRPTVFYLKTVRSIFSVIGSRIMILMKMWILMSWWIRSMPRWPNLLKPI